ncbi:MAG: hypothetical protein ACOCU6_00675 [Nanoarchaeota archaeon]
MDIFTYAATLLIAHVGLFLGGMLAYWSKDEVHEFKSKIPYFQMILFILFFVSIFAHFPFTIALLLMILSFAFIYIFWHKTSLNTLDYIVFGTLFVITSLSYQAHFYSTIIMTAFGILSGALYYALHTKPSGEILKSTKNDLHVWHHKHSNNHLHIDEILSSLFYRYYFFPIIALTGFVIAELIKLLL